MLEEENARLRADIEARNLVSPPRSFHYTRSKERQRDVSPLPMIIDEEDLATHPAMRPLVQGVSKKLEDSPYHQGVAD